MGPLICYPKEKEDNKQILIQLSKELNSKQQDLKNKEDLLEKLQVILEDQQQKKKEEEEEEQKISDQQPMIENLRSSNKEQQQQFSFDELYNQFLKRKLFFEQIESSEGQADYFQQQKPKLQFIEQRIEFSRQNYFYYQQDNQNRENLYKSINNLIICIEETDQLIQESIQQIQEKQHFKEQNINTQLNKYNQEVLPQLIKISQFLGIHSEQQNTQQEYSGKIQFNEFNNLLNGIKIINSTTLEQQYDCLVSYFGRSKSGKTWFMNKLLDKEFNYQQILETEKGFNINFLNEGYQKICHVDILGFNSAQFQQKTKKMEYLQEPFISDSEQLIYFDMIENFLIINSTKIVIMLNSPIQSEDVTYLQNIQKKIKQLIGFHKTPKKEIFVIHNFQKIHDFQTLKQFVVNQFQFFGVKIDFQSPQIPNNQYQEDFSIYPMQHFIIAQEFSEAAAEVNQKCTHFIKTSFKDCTQQFKQQIIQNFVNYLNRFQHYYLTSELDFEFQYDQKQEIILQKNKKQNLALCHKHYIQNYVDTREKLPSQTTPQFILLENKTNFLIFIKFQGFNLNLFVYEIQVIDENFVLQVNGKYETQNIQSQSQQSSGLDCQKVFNCVGQGLVDFSISICKITYCQELELPEEDQVIQKEGIIGLPLKIIQFNK